MIFTLRERNDENKQHTTRSHKILGFKWFAKYGARWRGSYRVISSQLRKPQHFILPTVGNNSIEEMNHHEKYLIDTNNIWNKPFLKFLNRYVCPCCNYPTLNERNSYEICGLCCWEDDGQDESNASKILGGPNQDYSLAEARYNFKQYLTMFRPSDTKSFKRREKNKINEIKEIYDNILQMDTEKEKELIENELKKAKLLEDSLLK